MLNVLHLPRHGSMGVTATPGALSFREWTGTDPTSGYKLSSNCSRCPKRCIRYGNHIVWNNMAHLYTCNSLLPAHFQTAWEFFRPGVWQTSLVAFAHSIPTVAKGINPCRQETFIVGRLGLENIGNPPPISPYINEWGVTKHGSRWCGIVEAMFKPQQGKGIGASKSSTGYEWRWVLHANAAFIFNITFLSFDVYKMSTRSSLRLRVLEYGNNRSAIVANEFKTGYFQWSYYSRTNTVVVVFGIENLYTIGLYQHCKESYPAKIAFQYQIHDNDFSFVRQRDVSLRNQPHVGLQDLYTGLFISAELHGMRINAPWGRTIVLNWEKFKCQLSEGEIRIIFYDVPELKISRTVSKFDYLGQWLCHNAYSGRRKSIEATIGDLTAVVYIERRASFSKKNFSLYFRYTDLSASVSTKDSVILQPMDSHTAYIPARFRKHVHFIYVTATLSNFVSVSFQMLSYMGYTSHQCILGGMMLSSESHVEDRVCSNMTGEYLVNHFHSDGITVGRRLVVIAKQYGWLSQISAVLTLKLDVCSGYVNPLPYFIRGELREGGIMSKERILMFQQPGRKLSYYYRLSSVDNKEIHVLHLYREKRLCYKLQIVFFDIFGLLELSYMINASTSFLGDALYYIGGYENELPARFLIHFSYTDDDIQHSDPCMYGGFRFFPNNRNDEPFIFIHPSSTKTWSIDSHFAIIGAKWSCIKFGSAISIHVEDGSTISACLREFGSFMQLPGQIITPGTCGDVLVGRPMYKILDYHVAFMLQRPSQHSRCCFYEGIISAEHKECLYSVSLVRRELKHSTIVNSGLRWDVNTYKELSVRWRDMCWRNMMGFLHAYCFTVSFQLFHAASCKMRLSYRSQLVYHVFENNMNVQGTKYNRLCLSNTCYIAPVNPRYMAWEDAEKICKEKDGSLASINSDWEWNFILSQYKDQKGFLHVYKASVFFIGLHSEVRMR